MKLKKRAARGKKAKAKRNNKKKRLEEAKQQNAKNDKPTNDEKNENQKVEKSKTGQVLAPLAPPPIKVVDDSMMKVAALLKDEKSIDDSYFLVLTDKGKNVTIRAKTLSAYDIVKRILIKNGIKFYTYTPAARKKQTFVLKGVKTHNILPDAVKRAINEAAPKVKVLKVTYFKYERKGRICSYFLVQISEKSNAQELKNIESIGSFKAQWEPLKRNQLFQCKNCQRMGHAAGNCRLPYRCVKCAQSHKPGDCPLKEIQERDKLKCANCMQTGHPASYKGCPMIVNARKLVQLLNERAKLHQIFLNSDSEIDFDCYSNCDSDSEDSTFS